MPTESPATLDAPYDRLAALPQPLWLPALVASCGDTAQRLADIARWREALLAGGLPPPDADFGDAQAIGALRQAVGLLELPAVCRGVPAATEQLLRTLLWHADRIVDLQPALGRADAVAQVVAEFSAEWQLLKGDWERMLALLQGLGDLSALASWDALRGRLHSRPWQEAERLSALLARLPALVALIRRLGRSERAIDVPLPPAAQPQPGGAQARSGRRWVETRLPDAPGEVMGIRLSDRIERMLGSELAQIRHPVLRKLWRARRAEGRLLTYQSEAVLLELRPDPSARPRAAVTPPQAEPKQRGPMILCLDTSGSMRGAPERLAKAVALEALRTAQRERRGCLLVAFGGPGEVIERELDLTPAGFEALLALMDQSFDGGTDLQTPIERALARVHEARWASADLLIVSDGEFGCTEATLRRLDDARERLGLRVQGVLVGDRETLGLMEVCDEIHWVRDWRRHSGEADDGRGGAPADFSPVHSKSLTAIYFPNALSARAARHKPAV